MIDFLHAADDALFRLVNLGLQNPLFDKVMPLDAATRLYVPLLLVVLVALVWRGGARGRICAALLVLGLCAGDWVVADAIKHGVARLRPFNRLPDARVLGGRGVSFSMPSSHALNCFCGTIIAFIYYRRSVYYMLPLSLLVGFSRVYNGMHYPSDVLAGAILGAGCGAALVWSANALWLWAGCRWFPLWHARMPSLIQPELGARKSDGENQGATAEKQWLHLGFLLIALVLVLRLILLASGKIELSEDEAYQWIWSKHLALSYYSKPPLIACVQFLGTLLWGDNQFGVRFFSPVIAAVLSCLVLRFLAREAGGRVGFMVVLMLSVTPLTALGSIVMTIDPLSVLFWTAAMIAAWRAAQPEGTTRQWLGMGLWMGLGFLSKYTNLFEWLSLGLFFALWPPARRHLRRAGPWLALALAALCSLPVLIWNGRHGWITVQHVASNGGLGQPWRRTYTLDFLLLEAGLLHPVFFAGAVWAALAFWRRGRRNPFQLFLFSMGAPLFLFYLLLSLHSRILGNWIAPSVLPLFCLMAVYWDGRWPRARPFAKPLLCAGVGAGLLAVVVMYDAPLLTKVLPAAPPPALQPWRRLLGWKELAQMAGRERRDLEARTGKPVFIICGHYGFTSQITFYLPEAKERVGGDPLVYYCATGKPDNQFYFWPDYLGRTGQNALFAREVESPKLGPGWFSKWWTRGNDLYLPAPPVSETVPPELRAQFERITDLGVQDVVCEGKGVMRRVQFFACENLRRQPRL
jgi:4-amino-4-deoxy-L-arabinose transferase-like glycosyltransferase/membrane-associated phospholipid phosphatase